MCLLFRRVQDDTTASTLAKSLQAGRLALVSRARPPVKHTAEGLLTRPLFNVPFMGPKMGARSTLLGHVCSRSLPLRGNSS